MLLDPETGKTEIVESDPLKRVDFSGAIFSEVTDELALTQYLDDHLRRYFKDKDIEAGFQWLQAKFPGKEVGRASWTKDEQTWVVVREQRHGAGRNLSVRPQDPQAGSAVQSPGKASA